MYIVLLVRYLPLLGGNSARKPDREKDERRIPGMTVFIQYPVMSTYRKKTQTFSSALLQLQYSEPQLLGVECYERISKLSNTVTNISDVGSEINQRWTIPSREGKYQTIDLWLRLSRFRISVGIFCPSVVHRARPSHCTCHCFSVMLDRHIIRWAESITASGLLLACRETSSFNRQGKQNQCFAVHRVYLLRVFPRLADYLRVLPIRLRRVYSTPASTKT